MHLQNKGAGKTELNRSAKSDSFPALLISSNDTPPILFIS